MDISYWLLFQPEAGDLQACKVLSAPLFLFCKHLPVLQHTGRKDPGYDCVLALLVPMLHNSSYVLDLSCFSIPSPPPARSLPLYMPSAIWLAWQFPLLRLLLGITLNVEKCQKLRVSKTGCQKPVPRSTFWQCSDSVSQKFCYIS
jgi:hypothetical protein